MFDGAFGAVEQRFAVRSIQVERLARIEAQGRIAHGMAEIVPDGAGGLVIEHGLEGAAGSQPVNDIEQQGDRVHSAHRGAAGGDGLQEQRGIEAARGAYAVEIQLSQAGFHLVIGRERQIAELAAVMGEVGRSQEDRSGTPGGGQPVGGARPFLGGHWAHVEAGHGGSRGGPL